MTSEVIAPVPGAIHPGGMPTGDDGRSAHEEHNVNHPEILRAAYRANGTFSLICAVGMIFFADELARLVGLSGAWPLITLGLGLAPFGVWLWWLASGAGLTPRIGRSVSMMDAGWVVGTIVLLSAWPDVLNPTGRALAIAIALVVAAFGTWQLVGVRRLASPA